MEDPHALWHPNKIMSIMLYRNVKVICSTELHVRQLPNSNRGATRMPALTAAL